MQKLTEAALDELLAVREPPLASLLFATVPGRIDVNRTQVRNALKRASALAAAQGLAGFERTIDDASTALLDVRFLEGAKTSLAAFFAEGFLRAYALDEPLPETVAVGTAFEVKPLIRSLADESEFFVLALSANRVRLLHYRDREFAEVALEDCPASLAEASATHDVDRVLNLHTQPGRNAQRGEAHFHGHGGYDDGSKDERRRFLHLVDGAVVRRLSGERAPVVLAGEQALTAAYRAAASLRTIYPKTLDGSPDRRANSELIAAAKTVLGDECDRRLAHARDRYETLKAQGRACEESAEILAVAIAGGVETLFVYADRSERNRSRELAPSDRSADEAATRGDELTNLAAVHTLRHRGEVVVFPPQDGRAGPAMQAILRKGTLMTGDHDPTSAGAGETTG